MTKIPMFSTANSTDQYVVAVDGYFAYAADAASAQHLYDLALPHGDGDGAIDDSPFGSVAIIPPHYTPKFRGGWLPEGGIADVRDCRPIDLANYIAKAHAKRYCGDDPLATTTVGQRLQRAKETAQIFGGHWRDHAGNYCA